MVGFLNEEILKREIAMGKAHLKVVNDNEESFP